MACHFWDGPGLVRYLTPFLGLTVGSLLIVVVLIVVRTKNSVIVRFMGVVDDLIYITSNVCKRGRGIGNVCISVTGREHHVLLSTNPDILTFHVL